MIGTETAQSQRATRVASLQLCDLVVRPEGIEPPTFGFVVRRSIQLS